MPGQIDQIDPRGSLPYPDNYFDTIMAYSVFTHLPETIHLHWMRELARVARPGCVFCLTIEPRRFIDFIRDISPDNSSQWHRMLSVHKPRVAEFHQAFDAGQLVFMPTNKGVEETYGDAVVPLEFIKKKWSPHFEVRTYIDDPRKFWQAVLVETTRRYQLHFLILRTLQIRSGQGSQHRTQPQLPSSASGC